MNTGNILKLVFFALLAGLLAIRGYFGWKARQSGHSASFTDDGDVDRLGGAAGAIFVIILLCAVGLLGLYAVNPKGLEWLSIALPGWLRWLGVCVAVAALGLQLWVHDTLQDCWFALARPGESHILITEGPYRWVRHPMYAALMLYFIGLAFVSAYWPFVVLAILMIPLLYRTASSEEAPMVKRYPVDYPEYMRHTPRFFPRLKPGGR